MKITFKKSAQIFRNTLLSMAFASLVFVGSIAHANSYEDIFSDFQNSLGEVSTAVEDGASEIYLPTYQEDQDNFDGTQGILTAIKTFLNFFKLIVAPVAVLTIVLMGARMVAAGKENEEMLGKAKNYIAFALEGLIIIFVADSAVNVFFGAEGEIFRGGQNGAAQFANEAGTLFQGFYGLMQVMLATLSVVVFISTGMRYVAGSYSDDQISTAKRHITWASAGIFAVGVSEFVVKQILFKNQGTELGVIEAQQLFVQVTNFVAGTMGSLSFLFLFYAGYLYVTARETEDQVAKAKKIIAGAFVGIIIALAAFALTSTLVELDAS
jgi:type IV secretory pathway VirB2 component (pilin)